MVTFRQAIGTTKQEKEEEGEQIWVAIVVCDLSIWLPVCLFYSLFCTVRQKQLSLMREANANYDDLSGCIHPAASGQLQLLLLLMLWSLE